MPEGRSLSWGRPAELMPSGADDASAYHDLKGAMVSTLDIYLRSDVATAEALDAVNDESAAVAVEKARDP